MCVRSCFLAEFATMSSNQEPELLPPSVEEKAAKPPEKPHPRELGGRAGPDPTRYGDWELRGRCIDF